MRRLIVAAIAIGLSLSGVLGIATAQEKGVQGIITTADGSNVTSRAGLNPTADGGGGTIVYGDITTGPGYTVIGPPSVVQPEPMPEVAAVAAPEPAPETVVDTTEMGLADTAVASETDLDGDNYADALEWDLGLDPNNIDTDGDGTADGDELNIYGTDPTIFDTDGDGIGDGAELFDVRTDPLTWDDFSAESTVPAAQETAATVETVEPVESFIETNPNGGEDLAQGTRENLTATDGNAAALGSGNASAAPGTVTRPGSSVLGPDGTYNVTETSPPSITISGDTEVLAPPAAAPADDASSNTGTNSNVAGCASYASWYDAQVAYEAAGLTAADAATVAALDPDYDGIACEEGM